MILDHENMFSNAQAITVTAVSTNVLDLGPNSHAGNSQGGPPIPIHLSVGDAFTAAGLATLTIAVQSSNTEGSGYVDHHSVTIAKADLALAGVLNMSLHIPPDADRFVRLNYTVATGPFTAGTLTAGIVADRQTNV